VLALGHLHSSGVVLRDLKLENVMLASDGHIKLVRENRLCRRLFIEAVRVISNLTYALSFLCNLDFFYPISSLSNEQPSFELVLLFLFTLARWISASLETGENRGRPTPICHYPPVEAWATCRRNSLSSRAALRCDAFMTPPF